MARRLYTWKIRSREIALGDRTLIMGVVNVTPDSFSDGGNYLDPDRAYARALEMEEHGADIIDVGAESTKPGAHAITASEELQRLVPVLKRLRDKLGIPISVDTYKAEVAERALELGAEIINDPSGFTFDPNLSKPLVEYNAGVILNHMRGRPETWATLGPMPDVMGSIIKDLDASVNRARRAGLDRLRIVVDPGIGFGKRREQNSEILARLGEMTRLELPILVGPSRKSFLAQPGERETEFATAAAVTASILAGAHLVRVHDVAAMKAVAGVADEVYLATKKLADARSAEAAEGASRRGKGTAHTPQVSATIPRPAVRPPFVAKPTVEQKPEREEPEHTEEAPRPERTFRPPPSDRDRAIRPSASGPRPPFRSAGPRGDGPPKEGSRPFAPRREGPPREGTRRPFPPRRDDKPREGARSFGPRRDGPPREGSKPFGQRRDGPPREGSKPFGPRRDGPPREGSKPFGPRRDGPPREGSRPFGPRRDGPPREGSKPFGRRRDGPPREGSRPFTPRREGPSSEGARPDGPRREGPPRPFRPRTGGTRPQGSDSRGPRKSGPPRGYPRRPPRKD